MSSLLQYWTGAVKNFKQGKVTTVLGAVIAILTAVQFTLDGIPSTNADWGSVVAQVVAAVTLLFAKGPEKVQK